MKRALLLVALLLLPVACGGDDDDDDNDAASEIIVLAASSLTDAFTELGAAFEAANDGVSVTFSFGGSSALREQIAAGSPADVFASADSEDDGTPFAANVLEIAVPDGNEAGVSGLGDFADDDLLIGLCAEEVPCGRFGREALAKAGVTPSIDTNEADVRSLLTKVEAGELDAGIVYRTDVLAAGDAVEGIEIPSEQNVVAIYPIAALEDAGDSFVAYVLSAEGQAILASHGFGRT